MGGKLLARDDIVQWGLRLTDGCMSTYSTTTGLGPGAWSFKGADGGGQDAPANQKDFNAAHGFWITDSSYDTRPEVFEVCVHPAQLFTSADRLNEERLLRVARDWGQEVLRLRGQRHQGYQQAPQVKSWIRTAEGCHAPRCPDDR
jgi:hypothetical protein